MPTGLDEQVADLTINNNQIDLTTRDSQAHLINIANQQKGQSLKIQFTLKQNQLDLSALKLAEIKIGSLKHVIKQFNQKQPQTQMINPLLLKTNRFKTNQKQILTTIPTSRNWIVLDNGHLIKTDSSIDTFLKVDLKKQPSHQLTLIYLPFHFLLGILLSLITLALFKFLF